jgi:tRNA pseudouridine55 synthase
MEKEYVATARLGATSDTDDRTGTITARARASEIRRADVERVLRRFIGEIAQVPPMYSAKKIGGKKLYELARRGEIVERKPARVTVSALDILEEKLPDGFALRVRCSSGTYIRALARDIGEALGTGAYLEELRRTRIGEYRVEDAVDPKSVTKENWREKIFLETS